MSELTKEQYLEELAGKAAERLAVIMKTAAIVTPLYQRIIVEELTPILELV